MSVDLSADGVDWDPYGTWDPWEATNEPDGLPDIAIIDLIEYLRDKGVVTLQSCAGHIGRSDGGLWIAASTVSEKSVRRIATSPLERVARMIHPWQQWALRWLPQDFNEVEAVLRTLETTGEEVRSDGRREERRQR